MISLVTPPLNDASKGFDSHWWKINCGAQAQFSQEGNLTFVENLTHDHQKRQGDDTCE